MKRANVVASGMALALGAWACGRQALDLAPLPGGAAGQRGAAAGAAGTAGFAGSGGASPTSRTTAVAAARPAPDTLGRECNAESECSWWQEPASIFLCCAGVCANATSDALNCGRCGNACAAGEACMNGQCRPPPTLQFNAGGPDTVSGSGCKDSGCPENQICCSGLCVDPAASGANCGGCGLACRFDGALCFDGACCPASRPDLPCARSACGPYRVTCKNGCKELGSDPDNCGACGAICPAKARFCASGICVGPSP
jgi:hypothetical protein